MRRQHGGHRIGSQRGRPVKDGFQEILIPRDLSLSDGDIMEGRMGIDADAAKKNQHRFFQFFRFAQCLRDRYFILARTSEKQVMSDMQARSGRLFMGEEDIIRAKGFAVG